MALDLGFSLLAFKHPAQYAEYRYCALGLLAIAPYSLRSESALRVRVFYFKLPTPFDD